MTTLYQFPSGTIIPTAHDKILAKINHLKAPGGSVWHTRVVIDIPSSQISERYNKEDFLATLGGALRDSGIDYEQSSNP